jgi:hypothetical protein
MINRIIVSSDDSDFLNFWPVVSQAWKKFFPEAKITLAFVTDRDNVDFLNKLESFGDVYLFPRDKSVPSANQAKICRHILACLFYDEVSMIEDIDTVPMQRKFIEKIAYEYEDGKILFVGKEVYNNTPDEGKIPISNMTGRGSDFSVIFDPNSIIRKSIEGKRFTEDIFKIWDEWKLLNVFDQKESILNTPDPLGIRGFSDESMIRALIEKTSSHSITKKINRSVDIRDKWIDRSWWSIDEVKMKNEHYVLCNFLRPFRSNYIMCKPVIDFIFEKNMESYPFLI